LCNTQFCFYEPRFDTSIYWWWQQAALWRFELKYFEAQNPDAFAMFYWIMSASCISYQVLGEWCAFFEPLI
jgi:hypothetical protein